MHKTPHVYPICGGRKIDHLKGNIEALGLKLSPEEMAEIDEASGFDFGFPHNFIFMGNKPDPSLNASNVTMLKMASHVDVPDKQKVSFYLLLNLREKLTFE